MRNLKGFVEIKFRKLLSNFPQHFCDNKTEPGKTLTTSNPRILDPTKVISKTIRKEDIFETVQNVKIHCGKLFPLCQKVFVYFPKRLFTPQKVSKALKLQMGQVILSYR